MANQAGKFIYFFWGGGSIVLLIFSFQSTCLYKNMHLNINICIMFMHPLIHRGGKIFISKAQCVTVSSDASHGVV